MASAMEMHISRWRTLNAMKASRTSTKRPDLVKFRNVAWFTNLDHAKRHEELILYKRYSPEEYPAYDNYDAINVDRIAEIPMDWDGAMGVPITFLDKHNPDQFEVMGITDRGNLYSLKTKQYTLADASNYNDLEWPRRRGFKSGRKIIRRTYRRLLIKRVPPRCELI